MRKLRFTRHVVITLALLACCHTGWADGQTIPPEINAQKAFADTDTPVQQKRGAEIRPDSQTARDTETSPPRKPEADNGQKTVEPDHPADTPVDHSTAPPETPSEEAAPDPISEIQSGKEQAPPKTESDELGSPPQLQETAEEDPGAETIWMLDPEFTTPLTPIKPEHNDSNPMWSPSGKMLAFERSIGDQRKIVISQLDGTIVRTIYFQTPEEDGAMDFFFPGVTDSPSYNAGMTWSRNSDGLVFMSNAGSGNYDLYLLPGLDHAQPIRLTQHAGKDSHPHWSPTADRLVFVSGRTGKADIFTLNLTNRQARQITRGQKMYHYPQWSPDGFKIAMIYGSNENHDILIIENMAAPMESTKALTSWSYDDLRPTWSPDGKKIAFYSNYNLQGDPKKWCIIVADADGPTVPSNETLVAGIVARQVIPDIEKGPAWMPDSRHIVFVRNDEQAYNPIFVVEIDEKTPIAVRTGTKMNHDITCSVDGTLAFRAQVEQWDHIYIAKINPESAVLEELE